MKKIFLNILCCAVLIWNGLISFSWGGQVVTKELKTWAKEAIKQEKSLQSIVKPNTVAVMYFHNRTKSSKLNPLQKGITIMLCTDLSLLDDIQLVERVRLQALVEELDLGVSGLVEPGTAPRVGRLLGAGCIVGGDIFKGKLAELKLNSDLLEVGSEKIFGQAMTEGNLAELFRMEKDLLFEITSLLKIKLTPEQKQALKKPLSTDIKALIYFFKGIEYSDQGNYKKASSFYKKALKKDPDLGPAQDAISELLKLGLTKKKMKTRTLLKDLRNRTSLTDRLTPDHAVKRSRTPKDIERRQMLKPEPVSPNDTDNDGDGYTENQGDCDDNNSSVNPGADEICGDGIDQDCDGSDMECPPDPNDIDNDGDGYTENQGDCDDNNIIIYPGAQEVCGDRIDQDCDGSDMECPPGPDFIDNDGDGYTENQGDCDDNNSSVNPGADEICGDGIDQDCDGSDMECQR